MKPTLCFTLQLVLICCVSSNLCADESQYLLTPSIDQRDTKLQQDQSEPQFDLVSFIPQRESQKHPLRTVVSSLAIVLGAFLLATTFLRKQSKSRSDAKQTHSESPAGELMQSMGELQLTPEVRLNLVRVGSKLLVLHLASDGVRTVAEISDQTEVRQLLQQSVPTTESTLPKQTTESNRGLGSVSSLSDFGAHPQVGDLLRRFDGGVKEFA